MATISSALKLHDGMSSVLRRINNVMNMVLDTFEAVQQASGQTFDLSNINAAQREYEDINATIAEIESSCRDAKTGQEAFNNSVSSGTDAAGGLWKKIKGIAATYASFKTVQGLATLSDDVTLANARLDMMNDGLQTTADLNNMIFDAAQRSRGDYLEMINTVAKLGNNAGDAFGSSAEVVGFAELIQKQFKIAGAGTNESKNAMIQLTQALGSGVLRGDELNSIFEQAPNLIHTIADYMDVSVGKIREMAKDGKITASTVKNAMFDAADEINAKFEKMPKTWGDIWVGLKNRIVRILDPVLKKINELANSEKVQKAVSGMMALFSHLVTILATVFDWVCGIYNFIADNWSWIAPIIGGIVAALLIYKGALLAIKAVEFVTAGVKLLFAGATAAGAVATSGATVAQHGFNAALWACPLTWVIALIIALIVVFVIFMEEIMGGIYWLGELFKNVGLWIANLGIAIWNSIKNIGLWFANLGLSIWAVIKNVGLWFANLGRAIWAIIKNIGMWFANVGTAIWNSVKALVSNIGIGVHNLWIDIQLGFWHMVNVISQGLKGLAELANKVLGWMGVNIDTSGLDVAAQKIEEINSKRQDYVSVADAWADGMSSHGYFDVGDAYRTHGYFDVGDAYNTHQIDWGKGWSEGYNHFDVFQDGWSTDSYNAGAAKGREIKDWLRNLVGFDLFGGEGYDPDAYEFPAGFDPLGYGDALDGIGGNVGSIADAANKTNEELSYLRDMAEKEAINRFTTAEIKVDMTGMTNRIDSNLDIDGVLGYLTDELEAALATAAEGVT